MNRAIEDVLWHRFRSLLPVGDLVCNPVHFGLYTTLTEADDALNVRALGVWNARMDRDMLLASLQVEVFDLQITPIVPQEGELLFLRDVVKVVELEEEEFAIVGSVVAALHHESVEAFPPGPGESILLALPVAGCTPLTVFGIGPDI